VVIISQLATIPGALANQHEHRCGGEVSEHMWVREDFCGGS